jgi:hypothetical protein
MKMLSLRIYSRHNSTGTIGAWPQRGAGSSYHRWVEGLEGVWLLLRDTEGQEEGPRPKTWRWMMDLNCTDTKKTEAWPERKEKNKGHKVGFGWNGNGEKVES